MFGLILGIIGAVALGCLVAYAVILTINWLKNKIAQKLRNPLTDEVAVGDINKLIKGCTNKKTLSELEALANQGYTNFIADLDKNENIIGNVDMIKGYGNDSQVDDYIGSNGLVKVSY